MFHRDAVHPIGLSRTFVRCLGPVKCSINSCSFIMCSLLSLPFSFFPLFLCFSLFFFLFFSLSFVTHRYSNDVLARLTETGLVTEVRVGLDDRLVGRVSTEAPFPAVSAPPPNANTPAPVPPHAGAAQLQTSSHVAGPPTADDVSAAARVAFESLATRGDGSSLDLASLLSSAVSSIAAAATTPTATPTATPAATPLRTQPDTAESQSTPGFSMFSQPPTALSVTPVAPKPASQLFVGQSGRVRSIREQGERRLRLLKDLLRLRRILTVNPTLASELQELESEELGTKLVGKERRKEKENLRRTD